MRLLQSWGRHPDVDIEVKRRAGDDATDAGYASLVHAERTDVLELWRKFGGVEQARTCFRSN